MPEQRAGLGAVGTDQTVCAESSSIPGSAWDAAWKSGGIVPLDLSRQPLNCEGEEGGTPCGMEELPRLCRQQLLLQTGAGMAQLEGKS